MRSRITGLAESLRVSPVSVSASETSAMMSPARASSIGLASLANISTMRPIFSRLPRVVFCTEAPLVEHAGIDADEGQRAVGIVDDLEGQRRERLVVRALALADRARRRRPRS